MFHCSTTGMPEISTASGMHAVQETECQYYDGNGSQTSGTNSMKVFYVTLHRHELR